MRMARPCAPPSSCMWAKTTTAAWVQMTRPNATPTWRRPWLRVSSAQCSTLDVVVSALRIDQSWAGCMCTSGPAALFQPAPPWKPASRKTALQTCSRW